MAVSEICNYRSLQDDLVQRGCRITTRSDWDLITALYEEHSDDLLDHLRGTFAFALWDVRRHRHFIARDHFG